VALAAPKTVILATTTSTQDSGLLDVLVPLFEKESGLHVKTIAVGCPFSTGNVPVSGYKCREESRGPCDPIIDILKSDAKFDLVGYLKRMEK